MFVAEGIITVAVLSVLTIGFYYIIDAASIRRILQLVKGFLRRG